MHISSITINLILFILCLIIQNCSGTLILGTATLATKIIKDPRTIGTQINDKTLEIHITNALSKNQNITKNARITSSAYEGNILLTGQSPSINTINHIEKIVKNIQGTKQIYNEIRNIQPITLENVLIDWWISSKIYLYCLMNNNIKLSNIKIITENKEIFLLGKASNQEKQIIIDTISKIHGITHINIGFNQ